MYLYLYLLQPRQLHSAYLERHIYTGLHLKSNVVCTRLDFNDICPVNTRMKSNQLILTTA